MTDKDKPESPPPRSRHFTVDEVCEWFAIPERLRPAIRKDVEEHEARTPSDPWA